MNKLKFTAAVFFVSTLSLSPGVMAFGDDTTSALLSGKGVSGLVQGGAWKFDLENFRNLFRPAHRREHPVFGGDRVKRKPAKASPAASQDPQPVATASVAKESSIGSAHAVPEMNAASGIIALSLMLGLFGLFRERQRRHSV